MEPGLSSPRCAIVWPAAYGILANRKQRAPAKSEAARENRSGRVQPAGGPRAGRGKEHHERGTHHTFRHARGRTGTAQADPGACRLRWGREGAVAPSPRISCGCTCLTRGRARRWSPSIRKTAWWGARSLSRCPPCGREPAACTWRTLFVDERTKALVGRALAARLAALCEERGYRRLSWHCRDANEAGLAFYERLDAERVDALQRHRLRASGLAVPAAQAPTGGCAEGAR